MKKILGIDGSKGGWIAVKQCLNHEDHTEIDFRENLIELLTPDIKLAIIDMPVGLDKNPQKGGRLVDKEARKILDKRKSSIFNAPCRVILNAANYAEANSLSKKNGLGISKQSWNLVPKIKELDKVLRKKKRPKNYE